MRKIRVLSLFDGISCGMIALERAGFDVVKYDAYVIEQNAIAVSKHNYPQIVQKGDVFQGVFNEGEYDILIGGSPCTHWSIAKGGYESRETTSSGIGWELFMQYVRALRESKPKWFLYENNESMSDAIKNEITNQLGVEPIMIDSADFSAQDGKRYYWTNIPIPEITNKCNATLKDIMIDNPDEKLFYKQDFEFRGWDKKHIATLNLKCHDIGKRVYNPNMKCATLTAVTGGYQEKKVYDNGRCRKLTPLEYERLQTLPDNYTEGVANSKRYCGCGDGWTVDVIAHILKGIENELLKGDIHEVQFM